MPPSKHVKVVIRTRPTSNFANEIIKLSPDQKSVHIHIRKNEDGGFINNQQENWDFRFDNVLHNASQEAVYEDCAGGIVKGLFEGYNGTILAYGQTGAGKTFTMTGATESYKHRGIIPRAISQVFKEIQDRPQMAITVRVSYLEIYNETLVDLLGSLNPDGQDMSAMPDNGMTVVEDKSGVSSVKGQMVIIANSEEDALNYLFEGETNRSISNHQMNANSTRSHCIFTLHIESRSRVESTEKVTYSKLNLVDLAGSERLSKTKSSGVTLKEAMYINKSLTFLEQVIIALADKKREHIPYRQSKLSNVLRDALGGNCNTLMIGNIWGERAHIEETISSLRFATRMMCVSNAPVVNVQYDPMALIKKYEREIKELKQELSMHDTLNNRSHIQYEPFTEAQRHELQKSIKGFLESDDSEQSIEIINLRQIRELFNQFRNLYRILQIEQEDLQERAVQAQTKNATDRRESAADGKNGIGAGAAIGGGDNSTSTDDGAGGVGEAEGSSFGIGLAPAHAKPAQSIAASSVRDLRAPGRKDSATTAGEVASKRRKSTAAKPSSLNIVTTEIQQKLMNMEEVDELPPRENPPHHEPDHPMLAASKRTEFSASGEAVPDASFALMGPPGGKRGHVGGISISGPAPNRAEEFENFKRGKGVEMNRILNENKATLKEKRRIAKDMAEAVNRHKEEIDAVKDKVNQKRTERESRDQYKAQNEATLVIDEEEYELIGKMKELKQAYRESFDALRLARTDVEYCTRLVDSCRSKLMVEFEGWYEGMYGSHLGELENMGKTNEDVMDIGEKFDKLQLDRMSSEDPDSYAFYNARKNTTRKNHKQLAPLKGKRPGMPISSSGYKAMLPVI